MSDEPQIVLELPGSIVVNKWKSLVPFLRILLFSFSNFRP